MNSKKKGELAEAKVLARLLTLEKIVLLPWGDSVRYDLVIDNANGSFTRGQVKTGRWKRGSVVFSTKSVDWYTKVCKDYKQDVDVFWVYCAHTDQVYEIPIDQITRTEMCLRVDTVGASRVKTNWAKDYVI